MKTLTCGGADGCDHPVTHIDNKGFSHVGNLEIAQARFDAERILNGWAAEEGDYIRCAQSVARVYLVLTRQEVPIE